MCAQRVPTPTRRGTRRGGFGVGVVWVPITSVYNLTLVTMVEKRQRKEEKDRKKDGMILLYIAGRVSLQNKDRHRSIMCALFSVRIHPLCARAHHLQSDDLTSMKVYIDHCNYDEGGHPRSRIHQKKNDVVRSAGGICPT